MKGMGITREIAALWEGLSQGLLGWMTPSAQLNIGGLGDFLFFRAILDFLERRINEFGFDLMARVMSFVGFLALMVLTIWILIQGYKVITGQLRESMMGMVANMAKAAFIVAFAVAFGTAGAEVHRYLTVDMRDGIHELVTGDNESPAEAIDESLGWLQVAMTTMDALDLQGDPALVAEKARAQFYVSLGTGGPAVVAGSMMLLYQIALALFIGLGPLFILCLLFDSTKSLFQKWLFYGIGTMFSMAVLSFMVSLALDMVTRVAAAMWISSAAGQLLLQENITGGMNSMAFQQGGMGLILTTLIITAPPMAAMFFNGTMGQFSAYAMMGAHLAPGQGQPQMGAYSSGGQYGGYSPSQPAGDMSRASGASGSLGEFRTSPGTPAYAVGSGYQPEMQTANPGSRGAANTGNEVKGERMSSGGQTQYVSPPPGSQGAAQSLSPSAQAQYASPQPGSRGGAIQSPSSPTQPHAPTYTPPPPPKDPSAGRA